MGSMTDIVDLGPTVWHRDALCREVDPDCFFPEDTDLIDKQIWLLAKKMCMGCEVRAECLLWALRERETWGIWGGLGPSERVGVVPGLPELTLGAVQAFLAGREKKSA